MHVVHKAAPKNKWDWGFMAKKVRAGGRKIFYFILFFIFLTVYVCTYIYYRDTGTHVISDL